MERIKALGARLASWEYTPLCLLLLVVLVLHISTVTQVTGTIFDEGYYVPAARSILEGNGTEVVEHPPLGQLLIPLGMLVFGDNPLGWRFTSVVFGLASLVLFYLICRQLKISQKVTFLATFILSLESLSFSLSSIAMLDVFSLAFMLASFWAYLKKRNVITGLFIGLAALTKLVGVLALLVILLHWFFTSRRDIRRIVTIAVVSLTSFLALWPLFDFAIWREFLNPIDQIRTVLAYTRNITFPLYAASPSGIPPSRPWDWIINPAGIESIAYDSIKREWYLQAYLVINPAVWALIVPAMLLALYQAIKRNKAAIFIISWFTGAYLVWIPISLITDRLSYGYYFYPAVGAVCMGIALGIDYLCRHNFRREYLNKASRLIVPVYLLAVIVLFILTCQGNIWLKTACGVLLYAIMRYYLEKMDERQQQKGLAAPAGTGDS